jgi:hypothetical protein
VGPPATGPAQASGMGWAARGPAAGGPSNKNFFARHLVPIVIGTVSLAFGVYVVAQIASLNTPDHPRAATMTTTSAQPTKSAEQRLQDELDYEAKHFDPAEAAFLRDLHGVWNFDFNPGNAVNEAHAMCAPPKGETAFGAARRHPVDRPWLPRRRRAAEHGYARDGVYKGGR